MSIQVFNAGNFISRGKGTHPMRTISSDELIVVTQGELEMFEEEHRFRVRTGEYLLLYRGHRHGGGAPYPKNLRFFWIHFTDDGSVAKSIPQQGVLDKNSAWEEYAHSFLREQSRLRPDAASLNLLFQLILRELTRCDATIPAPLATPVADVAQKYIALHYTENITTETISRALHCNAQYLGKLYRRSFGESVAEAVNRQRITMARRLLISTTRTVKEIAYECGYNDLAYFRRQFRKYGNMTPRQFRRRFQLEHWNTL